ncbi:aspartic peptidase domain-containing protein [Gymnopilus junonius]|uniref:Aspartic peptidase domain-containing protein n=1 Tax=Gymnopilus junonius TaxID=109634 RepID=A0A9P5TJL0_GYMJU|nr:aspartic peptidase domain-containing protein [Gymnopilus junonius]
MPISRRWKGKERALDLGVFFRPRADAAQEGDGGADGVVLPLDMVGTGIYDVAYTIPVQFGDDGQQQFSLQVDTGSSDLVLGSLDFMSSGPCGQTQGHLYNPSDSNPTGQNFSIPYLEGSASGPIVWDKVSIGGYTIDNQALAAANDVESEPLSAQFSGILGLALPLNSIIAQKVPAVTSNDPDGAAFASNLFSLTPISSAPASRFLSLSLSRPGSDRIPALLGIGRHPSEVVSDPSKITYDTLVSEAAGSLFWKTSVRAITVWVNGEEKNVQLGRSNTGAVWPSAVMDTGVPVILTTSTIANAVYGAIGVQPANDGMYYVSCTTPLNMTITIDSRPPISLHPLDLTSYPTSSSSDPNPNSSKFCVGLIQTADSALSNPSSSIGDMILGVPFLRNVYTVMAYTPPNSDGTFPNVGNETNDGGAGQVPIESGVPTSSNTGSSGNTKTVGGKHMSVGIWVLVGLAAFCFLCGSLFGIRYFLFRRRFRRAGGRAGRKTAYRLARSNFGGSNRTLALGDGVVPVPGGAPEDEMRYRSMLAARKEKRSNSTVDSDRTRVGVGAEAEAEADGSFLDMKGQDGGEEGDDADEFGYVRRSKRISTNSQGSDDFDPRAATMVGSGARRGSHHSADDRDEITAAHIPLVAGHRSSSSSGLSSPNTPSFPRPQSHHQYTDSDPPDTPLPFLSATSTASFPLPSADPAQPHKPTLSVDQPLLSHDHHRRALSMLSDGSMYDDAPPLPPPPPQAAQGYMAEDGAEEMGVVVGMAGVGTASRTSKVRDLEGWR